MAAGLTGSRIALTGVLLFAAASLAAAAPNSANRAKLSQPAPVNPRQTGNNTFQFALANGMQVLVIPDHRAPVATQMLHLLLADLVWIALVRLAATLRFGTAAAG